MNRYYLRFLLERELKYYKVPALVILILAPFGQICDLGWRVREAYDRLLRIVIDDPVLQIGHREPDPSLTAASLPELLDESGAFFTAVLAVLLLTVLVLPAFLGDTKDGKNIATQLRLPVSRLHYYGVRLLLPAAALAAFWIVQLITMLICQGIYRLAIPEVCLPAEITPWTAEICRIFLPFADPGRIPAAICSLLLFPGTAVLCALAFRGRDIFCICTALAGLSGCMLFFMPGILSSISVPVLTVITVLSGGYAVCRRKIF